MNINLKLSHTHFLEYYQIAGNDNVFNNVTGKLFSKDTVIIQLPENFNLKGLRFGWKGDASKCNLFSSYGLPVIPFRTDNYRSITKEVKYQP